MSSRLFAFAIWAAVAASLMYWGLRLLVSGPVAPPYTVSAVDAQSMRGDLARVFGTSVAPIAKVAAQPAAASRFKLVGVAAPRDAKMAGGLALISVDGKSARAVPVGRTIDDGWVLQSVHRRGARLASNLGADTLDLEVPTLPSATRGSLPPVSNSIEGPAVSLPNGGAAPRIPSALGGARPSNGAVPGANGNGNGNGNGTPAAAVPTGPPPIYVPPEELNQKPMPPAGANPGPGPRGALPRI